MRPLKSVFGVIGVLGPIIYGGGLLYYFIDLSGSVQEAEAIGLGPTVLGPGQFRLARRARDGRWTRARLRQKARHL